MAGVRYVGASRVYAKGATPAVDMLDLDAFDAAAKLEIDVFGGVRAHRKVLARAVLRSASGARFGHKTIGNGRILARYLRSDGVRPRWRRERVLPRAVRSRCQGHLLAFVAGPR